MSALGGKLPFRRTPARRVRLAQQPCGVARANSAPSVARDAAAATIDHDRATSAIESSTIATCMAVSANSYHSPFFDANSPSSRSRSALGCSCDMPCPAESGSRSLVACLSMADLAAAVRSLCCAAVFRIASRMIFGAHCSQLPRG